VQRNAGYVLHVVTASGAVFGMLALQAVIDNRVRDALVWLVVCLVLDGIDGPIARKLDVVLNAPWLSGKTLDHIVDYVTCVVVPVVFLLNLNMLPTRYETFVAGCILLFCALWWARTDQKTDDAWFVGFPCVWNFVVPTFLLLKTSPNYVAIISLVLCVLQLTNIKFPHPVRVKTLRPITLSLSMIYLVGISVMSWNYSLDNFPPSLLTEIILIGMPIYVTLLAIWKTWFAPKKPIKTRRKTKVRK
jgi:phosphatidylcholine synthase